MDKINILKKYLKASNNTGFWMSGAQWNEIHLVRVGLVINTLTPPGSNDPKMRPRLFKLGFPGTHNQGQLGLTRVNQG